MIQTSATDTLQSALKENLFPTDSIMPDLSAPIRPVKEVLNFPLSGPEMALILLVTAGLALACAWFIYRSIRGKIRVAPGAAAGNLLMLAEQELRDLKSSSLFLSGNFTGYEQEVCQVLRRFIAGRLKIDAIRCTSRQLVQHLRAGWPESSAPARLDLFLRHADLIKFAKEDASGPGASLYGETAAELLKELNSLTNPAA